MAGLGTVGAAAAVTALAALKAGAAVTGNAGLTKASNVADMLSFALGDGLSSTSGNISIPTGKRSPNGGKISGAYYKDVYPNAADQLLYAHNDGTNGLEDWVNFDRWYTPDLAKEEPSGRHYIFFCRPDLYLLEEVGNTYRLCQSNGVAASQIFRYIFRYYPQIITSLCAEFVNSSMHSQLSQSQAAASSGLGNSKTADGTTDANGKAITIHALIPYLTGKVESLQLPDYTIKSYNLVQPYTKYSIPYATSAIESQTGGTFDITFRDDGEFSVRKLFYTWIYYMDGVTRNKFQPKEKYLLYNAFDYVTNVYDILVDATGERVLWWAKYTGCFPLNVPLSDLSFNRGSVPDSKCTISFAYYMCEQLNIQALVDLNYNSLGYIYLRSFGETAASKWMNPPVKTSQIYNGDQSGNFLGRGFVGRPAIFIDENNRKEIKLKWLLPSNG